MVDRVVERVVEDGLIEEDDKPVVMRSLLLRHCHRHVHDERFRFSIGRKHTSYTSLQIFIAKVSSSFIAEQDYYKHTDDYEDYEYDDGSSDEETKKPEDITTNIYKEKKSVSYKPEDITTNINKETKAVSKETDIPTTSKQLKQILIGDESEEAIGPVITGKPNLTSSIGDDDDNDITYIITDKPSVDSGPSYEVTENVDDIPNIVTFRPIVTNFTITLPLNNATAISNVNSSSEENSNGNTNSDRNEKGNNLRRNSISIFHVNAEFDDNDKKPVIQNINIHKIPFGIFKVKDHVDKLKEDVLNYVHSTEVYQETDDSGYLPNILSAPKHFFNKLREKGAALLQKFF